MVDRDKALDMALGQIEKQFGKGSVMKMGDKTTMAIESVPTGALALDLALGIGGLPRGRITEIYGPESSGKSTLATHVVAEAQRNGGGGPQSGLSAALEPRIEAHAGGHGHPNHREHFKPLRPPHAAEGGLVGALAPGGETTVTCQPGWFRLGPGEGRLIHA